MVTDILTLDVVLVLRRMYGPTNKKNTTFKKL